MEMHSMKEKIEKTGRIEEMHASHAAEIARLERTIFPDPWSESSILETLCQTSAVCAAAVGQQGQILGYYLCYQAGDDCEIMRIAVDAGHRKQQIGSELMRHLEQVCRQRGLERILLDVRESNLAAIAFYEKHGFVRDGMRKGYYPATAGHPRENAILMSKVVGETLSDEE